MKCVLCKAGETQPGKVTITLNRDETTVIIKDVPADVCDCCGKYYLSDDIADVVTAMADEAVGKGVEVEIRRFCGSGRCCSAPVEFGILGSYIKTLTTGEKRCQESANISLPKKRSLF